jgi:flagellar hook-associated protein 1 FlgK
MSGLLSSLTSATRALEAQRYGLDVTGQNIANVNTVGYARREIQLAAVPAMEPWTAGGGVDVVGVRATRDRLLDRRLQMERPAEQREGAIAEALGLIEVTIGRTGQSIDARLSEFFDSASRLSADPTSTPARQDYLLSGERLASAFRDMAGRLSDGRQALDQQVRGSVDEINTLASRVAALNTSLAGLPAGSASAMSLRDEQKTILDQLSELVDVGTIERADGGVDLTIGNGRPLVLGGESVAVEARAVGTGGMTELYSGDYKIVGFGPPYSSEVSGGRLAGQLQVRDQFLVDYQTSLDDLAYNVATEVNRVHQLGYDSSGTAGLAFFTTTATATGAAAALSVNAVVAADPALVAASGDPLAAGDNQNARALADLRDYRGPLHDKPTFGQTWSQLIYRVGSDTQSAQQGQQSRAEIVQQIEAMSDAVSGVSLDEEAMMMLRFQRAYEANARFFNAINESIDTLFLALGA